MYPVDPQIALQIEDAFTYHPVNGTQPERYVAQRQVAKELALLLVKNCPPSRELSLALTSLQQTIMWANAAIAIHEKEAPVQDLGASAN